MILFSFFFKIEVLFSSQRSPSSHRRDPKFSPRLTQVDDTIKSPTLKPGKVKVGTSPKKKGPLLSPKPRKHYPSSPRHRYSPTAELALSAEAPSLSLPSLFPSTPKSGSMIVPGRSKTPVQSSMSPTLTSPTSPKKEKKENEKVFSHPHLSRMSRAGVGECFLIPSFFLSFFFFRK